MSAYENTPEDAMVNRLIRYHHESVDPNPEADDLNPTEIDLLEPEAHYNYYGDRGAADLYALECERLATRPDSCWGHLYEVKSANAVREATGANEIVRQFKKMKRYFFKDDAWGTPQSLLYELCFIVCPTTVQHVAENRDIYSQLSDRDVEEGTSVSVLFRAPDGDIRPAHPFIEDTVGASILSTRPEFAPHIGLERERCEEIIQGFDGPDDGIERLMDRMERGYVDV